MRSEAVVPDVGGFGGSLRANSGVPQLPASALLAGLLMPPPQPVGGFLLMLTIFASTGGLNPHLIGSQP